MADLSLEQTKVCTKCGGVKPLTSFSRDKYKKSGYKSCCLACDKAYAAAFRLGRPDYAQDYRRRKPEVLNEASARWRQRNPEKVKEQEANRPPRDPAQKKSYNQAYFERNRDRLLKENRKWYSANRERARQQANRYKAENPHIVRAWIEANRDKIRAADNRRRATPKGTIDGRMSTSINQALKGKKSGRKWESLVGYTVFDLMAHLERQFVDGMSWENMGQWHIDHVIPKSAFNYTDADHIDFRRCWCLANLQPLWAVDNIKKHAKLAEPFQPSLAI
ncbi:hypothetical protein [Devosia sp. SL43]|uniref:hypothetical protein n=1 Tax=Devosia sp. SL43 TaxID=2806348 RepID=UPI001F161307|nr:hypothetical protein [Devosia sp. SL43]UJW87962.1 hypothetical protein IM737_20625 [Devosia sp. SL43]